jgi:hypothetical protein
MGLTGVGITAVQHATTAVPAITSSEVVTASSVLPPLSSAPLPSLRKIVASSGKVAPEGSGLELEHSAADHRRDARSGEHD